jgi:hypothetical protein
MYKATGSCCYQGPASLEVSIDWDTLTLAPVAKSLTGYWLGPMYKRAPRQATAAVIRDQQQARQVSIDWDLAPEPSPLLQEIPNRILDWDPCIRVAPRQATAAVIRDQQQA